MYVGDSSVLIGKQSVAQNKKQSKPTFVFVASVRTKVMPNGYLERGRLVLVALLDLSAPALGLPLEVLQIMTPPANGAADQFRMASICLWGFVWMGDWGHGRRSGPPRQRWSGDPVG